jgi:superfamily I DNA/RNA helicase
MIQQTLTPADEKPYEAPYLTPSAQQQDIYSWFEKDANHFVGFVIVIDVNGNLVVVARAGCGKTTVIIEGVKRAPEKTILICAFSKDIATELDKRLAKKDTAGNPIFNTQTKRYESAYPHIEARTQHAIGYACVRRFRDNIKPSFTSDRADKLTETVCGVAAPDTIKRLVSKLHTKGREIAPHAKVMGDLTTIMITFECEPDESWSGSNFDAEYVERKALEAMELASQVKSGETIDGSDMIFLPVRNGWMTRQYDLVVVDEAQDMTNAQLEIAQGVLKPGGRMCIVGDNRQAIFGFRGADSESLDRLKKELNAAELGLTTTYRCGKNIVNLAQAIVPDFEAGESNPDGSVSTLAFEALVGAAGPGDFILSRVNAPLVGTAMQLLRAGKRARVAGRDIGKGLTTLVRKLKARSVPDLLGKIESWCDRETRRQEAQISKATNGRKKALQAKIEALQDQADMMISLADGAKNVAEVEDRIVGLFTDDGLGAKGLITLSSVHRAKGLEADTVYVLEDTLRNTNIDEENIRYVAITRAKTSLVMVRGGK